MQEKQNKPPFFPELEDKFKEINRRSFDLGIQSACDIISECVQKAESMGLPALSIKDIMFLIKSVKDQSLKKDG